MHLETSFDQCMALSDYKKIKLGYKYDAANLFLETYNYEGLLKNEELSDTTRKSDKEESVDLSDIPPLEGEEEIKDRNGLKS